MTKVYSIDSENLSTLGSVTTRDLDPFGSLTNESLGLFGGADISALYPYYLTLNPESYTASDFARITLNKGISGSDFVTQIDSVFVRSQFNRLFNDIQVILEKTTFDVSKKLLDEVISLSFTALNLTKPFDDLITNVSDKNYLHPQKSLNDLVENTFDRLETKTFGKSLFDSQIAIDTIQSFNVTKLLQDFANPVDLVAIPDGSTFELNKTLRNTVDNIVDEISSFTVDKKLENDNAYGLDQTALHTHKPFTDDQYLNDYSYFNLIKVLFDDQIIDDVTNFAIGKSLFDNQLIDDVTYLALDKQLYDLVDNVNDILQRIDFNKPITDLQSTNDVIQSFSVEKLLQDYANPIDLVAIPDGSTFQFNKTLRNTVLLSDIVNLISYYNRAFEDISYVNDNDILSFNKALSDSQFLSDAVQSFSISKLLQEQPIVTDVTLFDVSKTIDVEFVTPLERKYLTLDKVFADDFSNLANRFLPLATNIDLNAGIGYYDFDTIDLGLIDFNNGQYSLINYSAILDALSLNSGKNLFNELYLNDELQTIRLDKSFANSISNFDTNTLNFIKVINEYEYPLDNIQSLNVTKLLEDFANPIDLVSIPDGSTFQLNKTLRNTVDNISDNFSKVVNYVRNYNDSQTTFDIQSLVVTKALSDSVIVLDELESTEDILNQQSDSTSIFESLDYTFGKKLNDIFTTDDFSALSIISSRSDFLDNISDDETLSFGKVINDNQYINDVIQSFDITKLLQDFANPVDLVNIPDGSTFEFNKTLRNTVLPNDLASFAWNYNRRHSESQSTFDAQSFNVVKSFADNITVLDEILQGRDIVENETDSTSILESLEYSFSKYLYETPTILDNVSQLLNKPFGDVVSSIYDVSFIDVNKGINNSLNTNDDNVYTLNKSFAEYFTPYTYNNLISDGDYENQPLGNFDFNAGDASLDYETSNFNFANVIFDTLQSVNVNKFLQDFANPIDLVSIPDGSTFQFNKTLRNTVDNISDNFNRTVLYFRSYNDIQTLNDNQSLTFTKSIEDIVTVFDEFASTKDVVNTSSEFTSTIDLLVYAIGKKITDSFVIEDVKQLSFNKSISDLLNTTIDTIQSISFNKVIDDYNYILDDIQSFTFTKVLEDFANPVDLVNIPDGSTFQLNKTLRNTVDNISDNFNRTVNYQRNYVDLQQTLDNLQNKSLIKPFSDVVAFTDILKTSTNYSRTFADIIFTNDNISTPISGGNDYTSNQGDLSNIEDSGYLFMTDYADITYFAEDYVGESRTFT